MKDWRKAALLYRNAVAIVYQVSALKLSTMTGKEVESSAKETAPELYAESCTVVFYLVSREVQGRARPFPLFSPIGRIQGNLLGIATSWIEYFQPLVNTM